MPLRLAFAGTPEFAAVGLAALLDAGYEVGLVLSQPDRPAGRGQHLQASPVKRLARDHGIAVATPASLRPEKGGAATVDALARLRELSPDALVVAAYGLLLPEAVLGLPRGLALAGATAAGAINIHASLLPRWRGAAPVVRAIEAGDARTGITIMQMDAGLDTGPILLAEGLDIAPDCSAGELTGALARLGGRLVVAALRAAEQGTLQARPQPAAGVSYAHKIDKREAWIDWSAAAPTLAARIRAFDPFPGACGRLDGKLVKIWRAHVLEPDALASAAALAPGTVAAAGAEGLVVACGSALPAAPSRWLCLTQLQRPGGRRLDAREFLAGAPVAVGTVWQGPAAQADER
jgi:methionyl-tRNA formyltransferase